MGELTLEAVQSFSLTHPGSPAEALGYLRDPQALSRLRFLRAVHLTGQRLPEQTLTEQPLSQQPLAEQTLCAELVVPVPMLGEVDLPFCSVLSSTPDGALLTPQPVTGERAWLELAGRGRAEGTALHYHFQFTAHLGVPQAEGWGGAAFEKMVRAAAGRTLERVARELPEALRRGMEGPG